MTRGLILAIALMVTVTAQAHAYDCSQLQNSEQIIMNAETKQVVADELVRMGASRDNADAMTRASPDVDVARAAALGTLERLHEWCRQQK